MTVSVKFGIIGIDLTQACRTKRLQVLIPYQVTGSDDLADNVH